MAILRRPLLISGALHAVLAALIVVAAAPAQKLAREPEGATTEIALVVPLRPLPLPVVEVAVAAGSAGLPGASPQRAPALLPARRSRPHRAPATVIAVTAALEVTEAIPVPAAEPTDTTPSAPIADGLDETPAPVATGAAAVAPEGAGAGEAFGGNGVDGAGDGDGNGSGDGIGGKSRRGDLHARVLGNVRVDVRATEGQAVVSHGEATALRERDAFPRLHERLWPLWRPYIVALEVCVASTGLVSDVMLRSSASERLDAIVLAAVKTWRYRPRTIAGEPTPFCHGVVIKYERW